MRKTIISACLICVLNIANSQYFEAGLTVGVSSYMGELQPTDIATGSYTLTYGVLTRYHFRPTLTFKANFLKGAFYATDKYARNNRYFRNLETLTEYYEGSLVAEYNIGRYDVMDGKNLSPFLFVGVAGMYFNPKGRYQGKWIDLAPLKTEGVKYSQIIPTIPFGVGLKAFINSRINLSVELGLRYTMSDYLDDISGNYPDLAALAQSNPVAAAMSFRTPELMGNVEYPSGQRRGDKYKNDIYFYAGLTMTVNLASEEKMEFNPRYKYFWSPGATKNTKTTKESKKSDKKMKTTKSKKETKAVTESSEKPDEGQSKKTAKKSTKKSLFQRVFKSK